VIINDVGKVIGRIAIPLQEDKVILRVLLLKATVDDITYGYIPEGVALEAYDVALP
jgi:hypothetical protein